MSAVGGRAANAWLDAGPSLRSAFLRSGGTLTLALLLAELLPLLPKAAQVLDFGGGDGRLALALAGHGAQVMVLDSDPAMRAAAAAAKAASPHGARVSIIAGGVEALAGAGAIFDLVCCHSVLMYLDRPEPLVAGLAAACRPGGHVSLVSLNPAAAAMRAGLQERWSDALSALAGSVDPSDVATHDHPPDMVAALLAGHGLTVRPWLGLGIFTDHQRAPINVDEAGLEALLALEHRAGQTEPYRSVARCYHMIAQRSPNGSAG